MIQQITHLKAKWESELNKIIEDETWETICTECHKGINSHNWKEFDWKTKTRFFRTPLVISKFVNSPEAEKCWRGCGKVGDHTHIFWECPKIFTFWQGVKVEIMKILQIDLPFTPLFFLLEGIPQDLCSKNQRYILHIRLLSARKTIINWMKPHPPTMAQWIEKLESVYRMEYMTAQLQMKLDNFIQRWTPVTMYLDALKIN